MRKHRGFLFAKSDNTSSATMRLRHSLRSENPSANHWSGTQLDTVSSRRCGDTTSSAPKGFVSYANAVHTTKLWERSLPAKNDNAVRLFNPTRLFHYPLLHHFQHLATIIEQRIHHLQHVPKILLIQIVDRGTGQGLRKIAGTTQSTTGECAKVAQGRIGIEKQDGGIGGVGLKCNVVRHEWLRFIKEPPPSAAMLIRWQLRKGSRTGNGTYRHTRRCPSHSRHNAGAGQPIAISMMAIVWFRKWTATSSH